MSENENEKPSWLIYEPTDETLTTLRFAGIVKASGRQQALNRHYRGRTSPVPTVCFSEAQWDVASTTWEPPVRKPARLTTLGRPAAGENVTPITDARSADAF